MSPLNRARLTNGTLLALALGAVAAVFLTTGSVTTSERDTRSLNVLAAFREEDISRIMIERGEVTLELARTEPDESGDTTWRVKQPFQGEAEPFEVEKLLDTLRFAAWERRIKPSEVDRAAFGLDAPTTVVHIDMGEIRYRLRLGKEAASPPGSAYLEITGEGAPEKGIVLAKKATIADLGVSPDDFRGRQLMPYISSALAKLELDGDGGRRTFRRNGKVWRFDGMLDDVRVDRLTLDRMLLQFARTRAERFIDVKRAEAALGASQVERRVTIRLHPADAGTPLGEVEVGGQCPDGSDDIVALRRKPDALAACVPSTVMSGLTIPAGALVDKKLFRMNPDEVEILLIEDGDRKLELQRKENGFLMRAPEKADVEAEVGEERLKTLLAVRGELVDEPDLAELGLEPPRATVTLSSLAEREKAVEKETIELGALRPDGRTHARRRADGAVLLLGQPEVLALAADGTLVRSRALLEFGKRDLLTVSIDWGDHRQVVKHDNGIYTLTEPSGFTADGGLCVELADTLRALTADRWVADEDNGQFGLDAPIARVTVRYYDAASKSEREKILIIGKGVRQGAYGSMVGEKGVFILPRRVLETLETWVIDRGAFMLDPSVTTSVELVTQDRHIELRRAGEDFVQSGGEGELGEDRIRRIIETLGNLRAEAAIHTGAPVPSEGFDRPLLEVTYTRSSGLGDQSEPVRWKVGSGDAWRGVSIHYARASGRSATFTLPRSRVAALLADL